MALAYLVPTANMSGTLSGSATTNDYTQLDNGPTTDDTAGYVSGGGDETGLTGTYVISNPPTMGKINSATLYARARISGRSNDTLTWRVRGIHDATNFDLTWSETESTYATKSVSITSPTLTGLNGITVQVENTAYNAVKGSDGATFDIDEIWVEVNYETETGSRYWVGGTGTWSSTNQTNWSGSSGGTGGWFVPTTTMPAFFDANSDSGGSFSVTIGAGAECDNLTISGLDQTMTLQSSINNDPLNVYGNFTLSKTNLTNNYAGTIRFRNNLGSTNTITTDSVALGPVEFDGIDGTDNAVIQLSDSMQCDGATFTSGIVDLNNLQLKIVTSGITIYGSELNFGSVGNILITSSNTTVVNLTGAEFYARGSKKVTLAATGSGTRTITFPDNGSTPLDFFVTTGNDTVTFTSGSVVNSLEFTPGQFEFTGTWTNTALRIRNNLTLNSSMTVGSGTNTVEFIRDGAITTAGKTLDFPVKIDSSFLIQQARLLNSDFTTNDSGTWSVDIDDDTLILGIYGNDSGGFNSGAAYIFVRTNGVWAQQAKLTASDAADNDWFGWSVAISGDTVIVGAHFEGGAGIDRGAAYVFTRSGTTWTEQQKLTASDAADSDNFGQSVAVDGDTVIVGAYREDGTGTDRGAAYVFTRSGTTWTQQQKLTASDAANSDLFGWSVAIDGDTVVVGASQKSSPGTFNGAAYVFTRSGTTWTEQQKLTASDTANNDRFGQSVAIAPSALGKIIVVGTNGAKAAYVFTGSGSSWTQQQILTSPVSSSQDTSQNFGNKVAVLNDTYIAVSDSGYDSWAGKNNNTNLTVGAVFLYKQTGTTTWTLDQIVGAHDNMNIIVQANFPDDIALSINSSTGKIQLATANYDDSTKSAAQVFESRGYAMQDWLLSEDWVAGDAIGQEAIDISGDTVIVGANLEDGAGTNRGAAYVFTRSGTTWTQQQKLTASDAENSDYFGYSVAISGDTAIVGAYLEDGTGTDRGAAYVFTRSGTTWTQQQKLTASDAANSDWFGWSVAIDGDTVIVGARFEDGAGIDRGAAYVFTRSGGTWTEQQKLTASDAADSDNFGHSVAISGDTAIVGADLESSQAGAAYVFTRSGTTWTEQQKLTASDAENSDYFGCSVAIDGDTVIVGARLEDGTGTIRGAAYVFTRSGTTWTEQQKLTASDAADSDFFGYQVAIDGDTVVATAYGYSTGGSLSDGAAYVYTRSGTTWTQQQKLQPGIPTSTYSLGYGVAIDGDYIAITSQDQYSYVWKKFTSVTLNDNLTVGSSRLLSLDRGEFDANDYTVTTGKFFSSNEFSRTLNMGSGLWTLTGTGVVWSTDTSTNMTLNKETANILLSDTTTASRNFEGGGLTYNKLTIGGTTGTSTTTISGSNTFSELASTKTVAHTVRFGPDQATTTVNNFTISGSSGNVVTLRPIDIVSGDEFNLVKSGGGIISGIDYLDITNSLASPSSTWYAGANSTDSGGNSGWIFSTFLDAGGNFLLMFYGTNL